MRVFVSDNEPWILEYASIRRIDMDIFLTIKETGEQIQFPMLPEKISCGTGTAFRSYTIIDKGEVRIPYGEELTTFEWSGMFPGTIRGKQPYIRQNLGASLEATAPMRLQTKLSYIRNKGMKCRLLVTDTPINHDVYLEKYQVEYSGGYGDYNYSVSFVVAKDIIVGTEGSATNQAEGEASNIAKRPTTAVKTHTVKSGETLWGIAQKYYGKGNLYPKIVTANKLANPNMIRIGQVLTIPEV